MIVKISGLWRESSNKHQVFKLRSSNKITKKLTFASKRGKKKVLLSLLKKLSSANVIT